MILLNYKIMFQNWKIIMLKFAWSIKIIWIIKYSNHKIVIQKAAKQ